MADTFINFTPAVTPTGDQWKNVLPDGDRWAWVQDEFMEDAAWHIQNQFVEDIAWHIFARLLNYLALFTLRPLTSTVILNTLVSTFSGIDLKSSYAILQQLTDNFNIGHPLVASFAAIMADYGISIDEQVDDDFTIQPADKGTIDSLTGD